MRPVSQPRPVLHPGPARRPRFPSHVEAATGYLRARGVRTVAEFDSLPQAELEAHLRARFGGVRLPYVRSGMVSPRQVQDVLARCDNCFWWRPTAANWVIRRWRPSWCTSMSRSP